MTLTLKLHSFLFLFLFLSFPLFSESISLELFIDHIKSAHPSFKESTFVRDQQRAAKWQTRGPQDWQLYVSPSTQQDQPVVFNVQSPDQINTQTVSAGLTKTFWSTGGRLQTDWTTNTGEVQFAGTGVDYHENGVTVTYIQPLWRNRFGVLDKLPFRQADLQEQGSEYGMLEAQEQLVLTYTLSFIEWAFLTEQKRIADARLALATHQLEQSKKKFASNVVEKVDVLRAEDAVQLAKQQTLLADAAWKAKQADLSIQAKAPEISTQSPDFDLYAITPIQATPSTVEALRTMKQSALQVEAGTLALTGANEALKSDVNVILRGGRRGFVLDESFDASKDLDRETTMIGVEYRRDLVRHEQKATRALRQAQLDQRQAQYDAQILQVQSMIEQLRIQIERYESILSVNKAQIQSAALKTEEETRLYNQGRNPLSVVIQAQDSEQNASLIYAQSAAQYQQLVAQYLALTDQLL